MPLLSLEPPAPDCVLQLVRCNCDAVKIRSTKCASRCSCKQNNLVCTELCKCGGEENTCVNIQSNMGDDDTDDEN